MSRSLSRRENGIPRPQNRGTLNPLVKAMKSHGYKRDGRKEKDLYFRETVVVQGIPLNFVGRKAERGYKDIYVSFQAPSFREAVVIAFAAGSTVAPSDEGMREGYWFGFIPELVSERDESLENLISEVVRVSALQALRADLAGMIKSRKREIKQLERQLSRLDAQITLATPTRG